MENTSYKFKEISESDLVPMLSWRNNPDVRKNMYTKHEITLEEHRSWWEKTKKDPTKKYLIFLKNDEPAGVVGFYNINQEHKTADWAFYSSNPNQRGIGSYMEYYALNYAFEKLDLNKLSCEVLSFNSAVISFHRKYGFKIEGIFKQQHFYEGTYHDIYRLALFKKSWLTLLKADFEISLFKKDSTDIKTKLLKVGSTYSEEFTITQDQINEFAKISGDQNAVHLNQEYAIKSGFKGTIAHGFLTGSTISKILGTKFPGEGTIYLEQSMKFSAPVYPNEKLTVSIKVISKIGKTLILETNILNDQKMVISGEATVRIAD